MPNEDIHIEQLLLKSVADGDQKAFQKLFDIYWDRVYANGLIFLKSPELAGDLAQEVFIRIWMAREKLIAINNFESYLYRVSKNLFLDYLRKQLVATTSLDLYGAEFEHKDINAQQRVEFCELETQISHAISFLPAQMQQAFRLSRFHGLTHEQIARKMNISKVTSQNYIARSLAIIRKYLLQHLDILLMLLFMYR